jgi:ankyrin repeat protein
MKTMNPKYLVALLVVVALAGTLKLMNPNKKYSSREYWQSATLDSVSHVPEEALKPGNKNGSVLMWAAMATSNPNIISALVDRGADINEVDPLFSGTPLTGAASHSKYPEIIRELVKLGADLDVRVNNANTALMVAAMYNTNPGIIEELLSQGADAEARNAQGQTARDLAIEYRNKTAIKALPVPATANKARGRTVRF